VCLQFLQFVIMSRAGLTALVALAVFLLADGMHHDAVIPSVVYDTPSLSAHYIGKFCFYVDPEGERVGEVSLTIKSEHGVEEPGAGLNLMFFSDQQNKWKRVRYNWPSTCEDLNRSASFIQPVKPVFNETLGQHSFDFKTTVGVTQRIRHRYWYFALVACNVTVMPRMEYHLHTVNVNQGFQAEFGMDEDGSIALDLFTWLGFFCMFGVVLGFAIKRFGLGALRMRTLLQSLLVAVVLSSVGGLFMLIDSLTFARDGVGAREAAVIGATCECLAKVQLGLLQLFVSRGRDFLRSPREFVRRTVILISVLIFITVAVVSEIYEQYYAHLDWSTTVYFYSSKPGAIVLFLNIALFMDVVRSTRQLFQKGDLTPQLRQFYLRTAICATMYFLALPVLVVLACNCAPWVRRKFVERAEILSRFLVCGLLAYCLWPSRLDHIVDARLNTSLDEAGKGHQLASLNDDQPLCETVRENFDNEACVVEEQS